jgi:hypothetical protein
MSSEGAMGNKKTIIVLGAPLGRVGSSALMGLLKLSGVNVGGKKSGLGHASSSNPKGHFEPPSIKNFLTKTFKGFFPELDRIPTISQLKNYGLQHHARFKNLLDTEFGNAYPIALKGGRLLVLPFLAPLQIDYNVRVLMLNREPKDQVASIIRVWKKSPKLRKKATVRHIMPILNKWKTFVNSVRTSYKTFNYLDVQFEQLINDPMLTMHQISKFTGINCPPESIIKNWIDPRLVNRKK